MRKYPKALLDTSARGKLEIKVRANITAGTPSMAGMRGIKMSRERDQSSISTNPYNDGLVSL